jgi:hypothetical protein
MQILHAYSGQECPTVYKNYKVMREEWDNRSSENCSEDLGRDDKSSLL